jgi:hypothetical protein
MTFRVAERSKNLDWKYRVFASVDLVGSTEYKSRAGDSKLWIETFENFFDEFPTTLNRLVADLAGRKDVNLREEAVPGKWFIWKFVGDEILFFADITRHEQVLGLALTLKEAVSQHASKFKNKPETRALQLKATMWGAGFPVLNAEVETISGTQNARVVDFLGPSVDLGFRIAKFADTRRIPLSLDLVYFMHFARPSLDANDRPKWTIRFALPESLKGVVGGSPYPIIWLDRLDGEELAEDKLLGRPTSTNWDDLWHYMNDYYNAKHGLLYRPFIEGDIHKGVGKVNAELDRKRQSMIDEQKLRTASSPA